MKHLLIALAPVFFTPATAHDQWADGSPVPGWVKASCCGKSEAHLVPYEDVHHNVDEGYYYFDHGYEGHVHDATVLPSEDGHYWIFYGCPKPQCEVHCFFVPLTF